MPRHLLLIKKIVEEGPISKCVVTLLARLYVSSFFVYPTDALLTYKMSAARKTITGFKLHGLALTQDRSKSQKKFKCRNSIDFQGKIEKHSKSFLGNGFQY